MSTVPEMVRGDWVLFHPVYSPAELKAVEVSQFDVCLSLSMFTKIHLHLSQVLHRNPKTIGDRVAAGLVKTARAIFDFISGYKHIEKPPAPGMTIEELRKAGYILTEKQWLEVRVLRIAIRFYHLADEA